MPLGTGWWFNRLTNRYIQIDDHAKDACANPARFGLTNADLVKAVAGPQGDRSVTTRQGHVVVTCEEDRDCIIPRVCQAGYIRIRLWNGRLGWQFAGDPYDALQVLHAFNRRREIGDFTLVTFTDFGLGVSVTDHFRQFNKPVGESAVRRLIASWETIYIDKPTGG
jgi:hypothetical protein